MTSFLFKGSLLPEGFRFPAEYEALVEGKLYPNLDPWKLLAEDMPQSLALYGAILLKFPGRPLIPFAWIEDQTGYHNDGWIVVAYFDGSDVSGNPRVRIFDYANPKSTPWDNFSYAGLSEWLDAAKRESLVFKAENDSFEGNG